MTLLWIAIALVAAVVLGVISSSRRNTALRESGVLPETGRATMADVERLARMGQKIEAIRCYREIHGVGLGEAKRAVEELPSKPQSHFFT